MRSRQMYSDEPTDPRRFTSRFDTFYTRFAPAYDFLVKIFPTWRNWLSAVLPHLQGPRVLEVSFGTGYLMTQYAERFTVYGIDYNAKMVRVARRNLRRHGLTAYLMQADVAALPYSTDTMDTVVSTMACSGYPDGTAALSEMKRVLHPGGRLVLLDVNFPRDGNWLGTQVTRMWAAAGDVIRDMGQVFVAVGLPYEEREVGGCGSVHLYIATKR